MKTLIWQVRRTEDDELIAAFVSPNEAIQFADWKERQHEVSGSVRYSVCRAPYEFPAAQSQHPGIGKTKLLRKFFKKSKRQKLVLRGKQSDMCGYPHENK